jgi:hypothetical protein
MPGCSRRCHPAPVHARQLCLSARERRHGPPADDPPVRVDPDLAQGRRGSALSHLLRTLTKYSDSDTVEERKKERRKEVNKNIILESIFIFY